MSDDFFDDINNDINDEYEFKMEKKSSNLFNNPMTIDLTEDNCDIDSKEENYNYQGIEKNEKIKKKSIRLRKLASSTDQDFKDIKIKQEVIPINKATNIKIKFFFITLYLLLTSIVICVYFDVNPSLYNKRFKNFISRQYYQIVLDINYCDDRYDCKQFINEVNNNLVGQTNVIKKLNQTLYESKDINRLSLAFVGSTGVGKSLVASLMKDNFLWKRNIKYIKWHTFYDNDDEKLIYFNNFLQSISSCGENLIILDNLLISDKLSILKIDNMITNALKSNTDKRIKIIYIFTISKYNSYYRDKYNNDANNLIKTLNNNNITSILFNELDKNDLLKCIYLTNKQLNLNLNDGQIYEVVKSIDVVKSGCKTVYAKVKIYS